MSLSVLCVVKRWKQRRKVTLGLITISVPPQQHPSHLGTAGLEYPLWSLNKYRSPLSVWFGLHNFIFWSHQNCSLWKMFFLYSFLIRFTSTCVIGKYYEPSQLGYWYRPAIWEENIYNSKLPFYEILSFNTCLFTCCFNTTLLGIHFPVWPLFIQVPFSLEMQLKNK